MQQQGLNPYSLYPQDYEQVQHTNEFQEIQKWLLEVEEEKSAMVYKLRGYSKVVKDIEIDGKNYPSIEWEKTEESIAWMNDKGVSVISSKLDFYLSKTILLANLDDDQVREVVISFGSDIIALMSDMSNQWEVADGLQDSIVTDLTNFLWMLLTRPKGGGDRGFFKNVAYNISRTISNVGNKKESEYAGPFSNG